MNTIKTIATAAVCAITLQANAQTVGLNRADMNLNVSPGEDFYEYAGGGWMKANPLKAEFSSYGVFDDLAEKNRKQLRELFDDLTSKQHAKGSVGQKVSDLYKLAMDSDRLNREQAEPLKADLAKIAKVKKSNLTELIAEIHLYLANPFFGIGVSADLKDSNTNVMWLSAGTSGLPDRDYFLSTDEDSKKLQQGYRDFFTKLFVQNGYKQKDAAVAAQTIYDIEYKFAEAMMSRAEQRDYTKLYNIRTIDQMQRDYPAIQWQKYFELMGVKDIKQLIVEQPKVMEVANKLMTTLTDKQIRDYISGKVMAAATGYLSDDIYMTQFDFYGRQLSGQKEPRPRWKRALGLPNTLLGEAVGELYVDKYFAQGSKEKMVKLINSLRKALANRIANLDWMSDETKVQALVKLNTFTVKVGYPDKWRDYSKLTINPTLSLFENVKAAGYIETRRNLDRLGKPVDKDEWGMTPQTVNAYYNPTTNEICFPAAILQAPFFDVNADDATNYGGIGVVIGHEMTHGFDDQGRRFDCEGNMNDWWKPEDSQKFKVAAEKLARQFDELIVVKNQRANGHLTLGENIADQGGLRIAFDAFNKTQQAKENKELDGFTPAQRFYLSYGRIWAENITEEAMFQQTKSDPHSLGRNRVNATLRNIDTFFEAFGIKKGEKMWRDEDDRALVW
ncbi:MAG: M13 family metallopeptidase [Bacteroidales bacterium]|nr:M13 family metallopeptidase [Candidatus Sodaliphilus aphodohippi]